MKRDKQLLLIEPPFYRLYKDTCALDVSANYFCPAIPPARFRQLAAEVERMVDRKNNSARLRGLFSLTTLRKIKDGGLKRSSAKALSLLRYYLNKSSARPNKPVA